MLLLVLSPWLSILCIRGSLLSKGQAISIPLFIDIEVDSPSPSLLYATNLAQRLNLLLEPKESQNWVCQTHVKVAETLRCVYKETITDTHTLTGLLPIVTSCIIPIHPPPPTWGPQKMVVKTLSPTLHRKSFHRWSLYFYASSISQQAVSHLVLSISGFWNVMPTSEVELCFY